MKKIFVYDTETTGLPNWKEPSESEVQPHLVQLAGVLVDFETEEVIQSIDVIIKPDGWEIPTETSDIHGITTEYALEHGVSEMFAVAMLKMICGDATRIAYNKTFDQRIIRIAMKRYMSEEAIEQWAVKDDHLCAMQMARKHMGGKMPKLAEAYKAICGKELINAHSAMADTLAAKDIYLKLAKTL